MKLVSWNIWRGKHLEEVIKTLKDLDADVICLQEVKEDTASQILQISNSLNLKHNYCPSFTTDTNPPYYTLGNAILSKHDLRDSRCLKLSDRSIYQGNRFTEPRSAAIAEINGITIISTHIGFPSDDGTLTEAQGVQLSALLGQITEKTIVAIDLNSNPKSEAALTLEAKLKNTDTSNTPTIHEVRNGETREERIDYIFATENIKVTNFQIINTKASDHTLLTCNVE